MGRSKALLDLDGETFVRRAVRSLAEGGCDPVLVITAENDVAVIAEARGAGARVLTNPDPGEGPITSLRIALAALAESVEGIAYLPVDHPLVDASTVTRLIAESRACESLLTIPMHGPKRGHPAIFRRELFPELTDPHLSGGARTVVHRHLQEACIVDVDDAGVIADIDTPEAYGAVQGEMR